MSEQTTSTPDSTGTLDTVARVDGVEPVDTAAETITALEARIEELLGKLSDLDDRVDRLTGELRKHHPAGEVPEHVAIAISAAIAAYLGERAKVKRVKVRRGTTWAMQARSDIHHSHAAFGSR
ncbi:MAG: hypothetical protein Q4G43_12440 [Mobilicoccus sp.]|nr:hypothetical protein [Mobilicoccus sp.]